MTGYPDRLNGTFNGFCEQREDDGFQEKATLRVVNRQVQTLNWRSVVGRKGSCSFELTGFRQTRTRPHLELQAADGSGCKLMVYQDARRVTLQVGIVVAAHVHADDLPAHLQEAGL